VVAKSRISFLVIPQLENTDRPYPLREVAIAIKIEDGHPDAGKSVWEVLHKRVYEDVDMSKMDIKQQEKVFVAANTLLR
jgi:hypothetical protein